MERINKKQTLLENTITRINDICVNFAKWEADFLPSSLEQVYLSDFQIQGALLESITHTLTLASQQRDKIIDKEIENLFEGWKLIIQAAADEIPD